MTSMSDMTLASVSYGKYATQVPDGVAYGIYEWFSPGEGGTPYNGLYGEAPPERGTFFSLQVYKRVGISQV